MKTCFVASPFGRKQTGQGTVVDFERLYLDAVKPAVTEAGFRPLRVNDLSGSAVIHKAQISAIMNSDAMVADVTTFNPNTLYEIGMRHAINPGPTVVMFNNQERMPYDLQPYYSVRYEMVGEVPSAEESEALRQALVAALVDASEQDRHRSPLHDLFPELQVDRPREPCVFIGHGRSRVWARLQLFLQNELGLPTVTYETEARAGLSIVPVLERMLKRATFAVLVLTAEDETAEGSKRARQNVVHEAGLFQGVLGFPRAVMLIQKGLEEFSNVAGLQYIEFEQDKIEGAFYELQRALKREGLIR